MKMSSSDISPNLRPLFRAAYRDCVAKRLARDSGVKPRTARVYVETGHMPLRRLRLTAAALDARLARAEAHLRLCRRYLKRLIDADVAATRALADESDDSIHPRCAAQAAARVRAA